MTASNPTFVVVGAGMAAGAAATTLRAEGFDGRVVLIGEEPHPPYERPPLSKEYLRGETGFESALMHPLSWYRENEVELLLGTRAQRVDISGRSVLGAGKPPIRFDRLLVATGGHNRRLAVPGVDLEGVIDLRTREDADRIRVEAAEGRAAVIVGAGFIGMEVAASLRALGLEVDVVEMLEAPLIQSLGARVGRVLESIHRDHGVRFHFGQSVGAFEGAGRVEAVLTDGGARIECDLAVAGVGIEPTTDVVSGTKVVVDDGIVVDELCRTSVEDVFAAGDVANHRHPLFGRHMRVEHWENALKQGAAAARNMLGRGEAYDDPHWFWSDQYDVNLQSIGDLDAPDGVVLRGSVEDRRFVAFHLRGGRVTGAVGLNRGKDVRRSRALIRSGRTVDAARLRDEDVDLRVLAAEALAGAGSEREP
jgi:3-phenylpropionate/trans-cinnamate dioxygenase ferredoxin reductase component